MSGASNIAKSRFYIAKTMEILREVQNSATYLTIYVAETLGYIEEFTKYIAKLVVFAKYRVNLAMYLYATTK